METMPSRSAASACYFLTPIQAGFAGPGFLGSGLGLKQAAWADKGLCNRATVILYSSNANEVNRTDLIRRPP